MSAFKSDFLRVLDERGFIHQISDPEGLDALLAKETDHRPMSASTRRRPACISAT